MTCVELLQYWPFRMALFTGGLALICGAAWFALFAAGKLFEKMYPKDDRTNG